MTLAAVLVLLPLWVLACGTPGDDAAPKDHDATIANDGPQSEHPAVITSRKIWARNAEAQVAREQAESVHSESDTASSNREPQAEHPAIITSRDIWARNAEAQVAREQAELVPPESEATIANSAAQDRTLTIVMTVVAVALLLSLVINVMLVRWLARWRRRINSSELQIVPIDLMDTVETQNKSFEQLGSLIVQESGRSRTSSAELLQAFRSLQTALDDKDEEIKRLKKGYDTEVFRRFLRRFIRLDQAFSEEIADHPPDDEKGRKTLSDLRELLDDALAECGVIEFSPKVGSSARGAFGVENNYSKRPTKRSEEVFTIAEVLEPGFMIEAPNGAICLKEARVVVFVPSQEDS